MQIETDEEADVMQMFYGEEQKQFKMIISSLISGTKKKTKIYTVW